MTSSGIRNSDSTDKRTKRAIIAMEEDLINSFKTWDEATSLSSLAGGGTQSSGEGSAPGNFMKRANDTWLGRFGNNPEIVTISNGQLNISRESGASSRLLLVNPEGGVADFLDKMLAGSDPLFYPEQILQIQNQTITLRPVLSLSITSIVGTGIDNIITVTVPDTSQLASGDKVSIIGTINFEVGDAIITVTGGTTFTYDLGSVGSATPEATGIVERGNLKLPNDVDFVAPAGTFLHFILDTVSQQFTLDYASNAINGGTGNVPDGTAQFQHLEWSGSAWIAQQALAFGANSASSAQLNIPNNIVGLAWRNATDDGNLELKGTIAGNLDLTRDDNTAISFAIRSQNAIELDQAFSILVGSGSVTSADVVLAATTAKMKFEVAGAQRLELDATVRTDLNLAAPSGGALATFNVTSTDAIDPDNTITMTISSGISGVGQLESSTGFLNLIAGGATRLAIDATVGTVITQTAISINPVYDLFRDDTTNNNDIITRINFSADNSAAVKTIFSSIFVEANNVLSGSEDSTMFLPIMDGGFLTNKLFIEPNGIRITNGSIRLDEISLPSNPPANQGLVYTRDVSGTTTPFFLDSAGTETSLIAGGGGANTELSNLTSPTSINQSLFLQNARDIIPEVANSNLLGSPTLPFASLFLNNVLQFGTSVRQIATSGNDLLIRTSDGNDIIFRENITEFFRCDGGTNEIIFARDVVFNNPVSLGANDLSNSADITPTLDSTFDIGTTSLKYDNMFANNFLFDANTGMTLGTFGVSIFANNTNDNLFLSADGTVFIQANSTGGITFFGGGSTLRQIVTGSRGGNAALTSLLTALDNYRLIDDQTTA